MVSIILLLLGCTSLAAAGGMNRTIAASLMRSGARTGTPTFNVDATQATDTAVTGTAAVYGINDNENSNGGLGCRGYSGDGSTNNGWPSISQWVSFNYIWQVNYEAIQNSCSGQGLPNMSDQEMNDLHDGIQAVADQFHVDHRFILAEILTESSGCVRVVTTGGPANNNIYNPGLLQDYDGFYTCNCNQLDQYHQNCGVVTPCPAATINGMIREGAVGTDSGVGLSYLINAAQSQGATDAQVFYVAAEWYNQGQNFPVGSSLDARNYASHVAQWLTGCTAPV